MKTKKLIYKQSDKQTKPIPILKHRKNQMCAFHYSTDSTVSFIFRFSIIVVDTTMAKHCSSILMASYLAVQTSMVKYILSGDCILETCLAATSQTCIVKV